MTLSQTVVYLLHPVDGSMTEVVSYPNSLIWYLMFPCVDWRAREKDNKRFCVVCTAINKHLLKIQRYLVCSYQTTFNELGFTFTFQFHQCLHTAPSSLTASSSFAISPERNLHVLLKRAAPESNPQPQIAARVSEQADSIPVPINHPLFFSITVLLNFNLVDTSHVRDWKLHNVQFQWLPHSSTNTNT